MMLTRILHFKNSKPWFRIVSILCCAAFAFSLQAAEVYVVMGQSNAWRLSNLHDGGAGGKVPVHYFAMDCVSEPTAGNYRRIEGVHPNSYGFGLAKTLVDAAQDDVVIIQYARCGAGLWSIEKDGWFVGSHPKKGQVYNDGLYGSFLAYMKHARHKVEKELKLKWKLKGIFWHQGEGDCSDTHIERYESRLFRLFERLRMDFGRRTKIVAGQIRQLSPLTEKVNGALAKWEKTDRYMQVVSGQEFSFESPTDVHFNDEGCFSMGKKMAEAMLAFKK